MPAEKTEPLAASSPLVLVRMSINPAVDNIIISIIAGISSIIISPSIIKEGRNDCIEPNRTTENVAIKNIITDRRALKTFITFLD